MASAADYESLCVITWRIDNFKPDANTWDMFFLLFFFLGLKILWKPLTSSKIECYQTILGEN